MNDPFARPSSVSCGRCRASTALQWAPIGYGDWSGTGQCPACGAGVLSIFSESGIKPAELDYLLPALIGDGEASLEFFFQRPEPPKNAGFGVLIA